MDNGRSHLEQDATCQHQDIFFAMGYYRSNQNSEQPLTYPQLPGLEYLAPHTQIYPNGQYLLGSYSSSSSNLHTLHSSEAYPNPPRRPFPFPPLASIEVPPFPPRQSEPSQLALPLPPFASSLGTSADKNPTRPRQLNPMVPSFESVTSLPVYNSTLGYQDNTSRNLRLSLESSGVDPTVYSLANILSASAIASKHPYYQSGDDVYKEAQNPVRDLATALAIAAAAERCIGSSESTQVDAARLSQSSAPNVTSFLGEYPRSVDERNLERRNSMAYSSHPNVFGMQPQSVGPPAYNHLSQDNQQEYNLGGLDHHLGKLMLHQRDVYSSDHVSTHTNPQLSSLSRRKEKCQQDLQDFFSKVSGAQVPSLERLVHLLREQQKVEPPYAIDGSSTSGMMYQDVFECQLGGAPNCSERVHKEISADPLKSEVTGNDVLLQLLQQRGAKERTHTDFNTRVTSQTKETDNLEEMGNFEIHKRESSSDLMHSYQEKSASNSHKNSSSAGTNGRIAHKRKKSDGVKSRLCMDDRNSIYKGSPEDNGVTTVDRMVTDSLRTLNIRRASDSARTTDSARCTDGARATGDARTMGGARTTDRARATGDARTTYCAKAVANEEAMDTRGTKGIEGALEWERATDDRRSLNKEIAVHCERDTDNRKTKNRENATDTRKLSHTRSRGISRSEHSKWSLERSSSTDSRKSAESRSSESVSSAGSGSSAGSKRSDGSKRLAGNRRSAGSECSVGSGRSTESKRSCRSERSTGTSASGRSVGSKSSTDSKDLTNRRMSDASMDSVGRSSSSGSMTSTGSSKPKDKANTMSNSKSVNHSKSGRAAKAENSRKLVGITVSPCRRRSKGSKNSKSIGTILAGNKKSLSPKVNMELCDQASKCKTIEPTASTTSPVVDTIKPMTDSARSVDYTQTLEDAAATEVVMKGCTNGSTKTVNSTEDVNRTEGKEGSKPLNTTGPTNETETMNKTKSPNFLDAQFYTEVKTSRSYLWFSGSRIPTDRTRSSDSGRFSDCDRDLDSQRSSNRRFSEGELSIDSGRNSDIEGFMDIDQFSDYQKSPEVRELFENIEGLECPEITKTDAEFADNLEAIDSKESRRIQESPDANDTHVGTSRMEMNQENIKSTMKIVDATFEKSIESAHTQVHETPGFISSNVVDESDILTHSTVSVDTNMEQSKHNICAVNGSGSSNQSKVPSHKSNFSNQSHTEKGGISNIDLTSVATLVRPSNLMIKCEDAVSGDFSSNTGRKENESIEDHNESRISDFQQKKVAKEMIATSSPINRESPFQPLEVSSYGWSQKVDFRDVLQDRCWSFDQRQSMQIQSIELCSTPAKALLFPARSLDSIRASSLLKYSPLPEPNLLHRNRLQEENIWQFVPGMDHICIPMCHVEEASCPLLSCFCVLCCALQVITGDGRSPVEIIDGKKASAKCKQKQRILF